MERQTGRLEAGRPQRRVRFRVASARSGRVLAEVFREEPLEDPADSDTTGSSEPERPASPANSEANSHLSAAAGARADDSGSEPDDLLLYASGANERVFSGKRVTIRSKNGTVRGVRDKVSAGQMLFNTLAKVYGGSLQGNEPKRP
ncbi:glutaredoxin domain-containing cysteine-rich protein 1 [Pygocentrus nattereri]|uniref:glutaredoxin domain-containing cysteine-rich protein 1 n=1 Tax=Pygocentrus nattereri TaxID=42514 RepID=UPI0008142C5E|nr:glutaredoxin domain-containing cysteine-rich protein 1 [Pygocentrus nattereri]